MSLESPAPASAAVDEALDVLVRLLQLGDELRLPTPSLARFWCRGGSGCPRLFVWGAPGSRVPELFERWTGARLSGDELRGQIVEATPDVDAGWLYSDGSWECEGPRRSAVRLVAGRPFSGGRVSATIADGGEATPLAIDDASWQRRVTSVIVVTPASAVLGTLEQRQLERLRAAGCRVGLLVTGLEGATEEDRTSYRQEIEEFKVQPLLRKVGPLDVWYTSDPRDDEALDEALEQWVLGELATGHRGQMERAIDACLEQMSLVLAERDRDRERRQQAADFLRDHASDQVDRLGDLISQQRQGLESRVRRCLGEAIEASRSMGRAPSGESFWTAAAELQTAVREVDDFEAQIRLRYRSEIDEFCAAYPTRLGRFVMPWPSPTEAESATSLPIERLRSDFAAVVEQEDAPRTGRRGLGARIARFLQRDSGRGDRAGRFDSLATKHLKPVVDTALRRLADDTMPRVTEAAGRVLDAFRRHLAEQIEQDVEEAEAAGAARRSFRQLSERWREARDVREPGDQ